jgi:hypothetical protein
MVVYCQSERRRLIVLGEHPAALAASRIVAPRAKAWRAASSRADLSIERM